MSEIDMPVRVHTVKIRLEQTPKQVAYSSNPSPNPDKRCLISFSFQCAQIGNLAFTSDLYTIFLGVIMLSMGITLTFDDFARTSQFPLPIGVGYLCQVLQSLSMSFECFISITQAIAAQAQSRCLAAARCIIRARPRRRLLIHSTATGS